MKKIILLSVFFSLFLHVGCESVEPNFLFVGDESVEPSNDFYQIDFIKIGGIMGLQHKTSVYEGGSATFSQFFDGKEFVVSSKLSREQFAGLSSALNENVIFRFADSYRRPQPLIDGFNYYIIYKSSKGSKNILIDDEADIPAELEKILVMMYAISSTIQTNPEYGTLIPIWKNESAIKSWPFSQVRLHVKVFYYDSLNISNDIKQYFDEIRGNSGYDLLYWDQDSLYEIYDSRDQGYFNVHTGFPAKLWHQQFGLDINEFKEHGIGKTVEEWNRMGITFQKTYVFVTDSLSDNGKALKTTLLPGSINENITGMNGLFSGIKTPKP